MTAYTSASRTTQTIPSTELAKPTKTWLNLHLNLNFIPVQTEFNGLFRVENFQPGRLCKAVPSEPLRKFK